MTMIAKSVVTLRIMGDAVVPTEVSKLLGCEPSGSYSKGQVMTSPSGKQVTRKSGMWMIETDDSEPGAVDAQVSKILSQLNPDLAVWKKLSEDYKIDLFCGLFMDEVNEGLELSPATLGALGQRGIMLGLDIYGPADAD